LDASNRLHEALFQAFDVFLTFLPDAAVRVGGGYRVVIVPSFPIPMTNSVWCGGSIDEAALRELPAALAAIEAAGMPPALIARDGVDTRVQVEARRLGLTSEE